MREKIIAGNWKMNLAQDEALTYFKAITKAPIPAHVKVVIAPSFVYLSDAVKHLTASNIAVAAQDVHQEKHGAFTGDVSASMLKSIGVTKVIIGHSERRATYKETGALLKQKVEAALATGMQVIFCVGEELLARQNQEHYKVVQAQLKASLFNLEASAFQQLVIAYEPVWAIGTGETATPEQAQEMHAFIRSEIAANVSSKVAVQIPILYGGSVKPDNAQSLFTMPDVDGALVGGASLKVATFCEIVNAL